MTRAAFRSGETSKATTRGSLMAPAGSASSSGLVDKWSVRGQSPIPSRSTANSLVPTLRRSFSTCSARILIPSAGFACAHAAGSRRNVVGDIGGVLAFDRPLEVGEVIVVARDRPLAQTGEDDAVVNRAEPVKNAAAWSASGRNIASSRTSRSQDRPRDALLVRVENSIRRPSTSSIASCPVVLAGTLPYLDGFTCASSSSSFSIRAHKRRKCASEVL